MRFIPKNPEPASFTTWKQEARKYGQLTKWNALQNPEKGDVFSSLIQEQGHICCYCGQRITQERIHIEHLKPRSECVEEEMFDYGNFLASCPGYDLDETQDPKTNQKQEFCGHKKSNWYDASLFVTPLAPDCSKYFRYTASGEILPSTDLDRQAAAKTTIERLGLNHPKLDRGRNKAIEGLLQDLELRTDADLQTLLNVYNQPDADGKLIPYCAAITYQLQQLLP
jgi:uncharacterized protein (TIGR02646 family)